jgi:tetratricopeptide (TPR) repeat protein
METAELDLDMHAWSESIALWNRIEALANGTPEAARFGASIDGGLGEAWLGEGNPARAEPLLRKSLQLFRNDPNSSSLQLATALGTLARLYILEDKLALAEETLQEAIGTDGAVFGMDHPQVGALLELRATIYSRQGEMQDAREDLEHARRIMNSHFGADSLAVGVVYAELGEAEQRANRPQAAVDAYSTALRIFQKTGVETSPTGTALVAHYAAALKAAHRGDEARALLAPGGAQSFMASGAPHAAGNK